MTRQDPASKRAAEESQKLTKQLEEAMVPPPVDEAIAHVLEAADRACMEARRLATLTPPPKARVRALSIPEDPR